MLMHVCNMPGIDRKSRDQRVTHDSLTTKTNADSHCEYECCPLIKPATVKPH